MSVAFVPSASELIDLINQVEHAVQMKTGGRIHGLRIRLDDRCLIVSGQTSTYYNKQLATHAIRDAVDDLTVQNEVEVRCREAQSV